LNTFKLMVLELKPAALVSLFAEIVAFCSKGGEIE
jgi:hypothetical protein